MPRLTDEELQTAIVKGFAIPFAHKHVVQMFTAIREAEREKGETVVNTDSTQAYADKVLEKQRQIIEAKTFDEKQWTKPKDWATVVHACAVQLVDAANEAASQKASKETK